MKQIFSQRRPLEPAIHIVSWLLIFGFPLVFADRGNSMDWHQFLRHSCVPLCYFLIFYINYLWLVPRYLFNDEMRKYIIANAILIFFSSLMLHLLLEAFSTPPPEEFTRADASTLDILHTRHRADDIRCRTGSCHPHQPAMETSARNAAGSRTAKDGSGIEESQEPIEPPFPAQHTE